MTACVGKKCVKPIEKEKEKRGSRTGDKNIPPSRVVNPTGIYLVNNAARQASPADAGLYRTARPSHL